MPVETTGPPAADLLWRCCTCGDRARSRQTVAMRTRRPRPPAVPRSASAGFCFPPEVILLSVRWYLRFALSYRDVEELLAERGVEVDHVTIYRSGPPPRPLGSPSLASYRAGASRQRGLDRASRSRAALEWGPVMLSTGCHFISPVRVWMIPREGVRRSRTLRAWGVSAEAGPCDDVGDADPNCGEACLYE
jgi:hypothetical protein